MAIVDTKPKTLTNVVKLEHWVEYGYCRQEVTIDETAPMTYVAGTVLGVDSVSGKYRKAATGGANGSATPAAIFMFVAPTMDSTLDVVAGGDEKAIVLVKGPAIIAGKELDLGTGVTVAAVKAALEPKGINVEDQVVGQLNN